MALERIGSGVHPQRASASSTSDLHQGPWHALSPPPYSESSLVMALRDCTSFTSPFDEPNVFKNAGCALVSMIVLAEILLLEKQTYQDINLINGIHHPRFRKSVILTYEEQAANKTLEVGRLCEISSFQKPLRLLSSNTLLYTHKAFYGLLLGIRDESSKSGLSVGALITRGVETLAVVSVATGDAFPDRRHIYAVFSAHVRLDNQPCGAATIFFPTATSATSCLYELLEATKIHDGHPDMISDPTLGNCVVYLFTAREAPNGTGDSKGAPQPLSEPVSPGSPSSNERPYDHTIHVYSFRSASGTKLEPSTLPTSNVLRKLHDERAISRERAQNNYLDALKSSLREDLVDSQANPNDSPRPSRKGKERALQDKIVPSGSSRRHSLYTGITSGGSGSDRYPPVGRQATSSNTAPQHVAWDATIDSDLVPVIVESERPEDARKLASLEAKYAKKHVSPVPNRLHRQWLEETPQGAPESRPDPASHKLKKSISSLFNGNRRALSTERPFRSRMVIPPPDEMDAPGPSLRNNGGARDDDPELTLALRAIREQEERERQQEDEDLNLALALSLQSGDNINSPVSPVYDDAFVSLTPATSLPRSPRHRRPPPPPVDGQVFRSIYDEDALPFITQPRHPAPSTGTQDATIHWGGNPGLSYQADLHRFHDSAKDRPSLGASEGWAVEDPQADADLEFALRMQAEETELEEENARLIESLGQQETFDCVMCMETNPVDDVAVVDGCEHRFCRNCLKQYLTTKLSEANFPIPCPTCSANKNRENPGEISAFLAMQLGITEKQYEMWNKFDLARISVSVQCPHCRQTSLVDREEFQASRMGVCPLPTCRREWCKKCNVVVNPGAGPHSCDGQQEMDTYIRTVGIRRCPGCTTPIERTAGCDHMTCRVPGCRTEFSYRTGRRM